MPIRLDMVGHNVPDFRARKRGCDAVPYHATISSLIGVKF